MKNVALFWVCLTAVVLSGCAPALGTLELSPEAAVLTDAEAQAGRIGVQVTYRGEGFDPLKLSLYAALGDEPWALAATNVRQSSRFELLWPGALSPARTGAALTAATTVRIQAVYTEGRQSVSARTSVTVVP